MKVIRRDNLKILAHLNDNDEWTFADENWCYDYSINNFNLNDKTVEYIMLGNPVTYDSEDNELAVFTTWSIGDDFNVEEAVKESYVATSAVVQLICLEQTIETEDEYTISEGDYVVLPVIGFEDAWAPVIMQSQSVTPTPETSVEYASYCLTMSASGVPNRPASAGDYEPVLVKYFAVGGDVAFNDYDSEAEAVVSEESLVDYLEFTYSNISNASAIRDEIASAAHEYSEESVDIYAWYLFYPVSEESTVLGNLQEEE